MLMVQTHLAKQCKHVNVIFFFTIVKIYNTTGGKTPDLILSVQAMAANVKKGSASYNVLMDSL